MAEIAFAAGLPAPISTPLYPDHPLRPSTVTTSPSRIRRVPFCVPTTHGIRYSRATIAQCESTPPESATAALTIENSCVYALWDTSQDLGMPVGVEAG